MGSRSLAAVALAAGVGAAVLGAVHGSPVGAQPLRAAVGDPNAGAAVFASAGCKGCHTLAAANATGKAGPNLDTLKPTAAAVAAQVTNGGGGMPPFRGTLTAKQIEDVSEFVAQASRGWRPGGGTTPTAPTTPAAPGAAARVTATLNGRAVRLSVARVAPGRVTIVARNTTARARVVRLLRGGRATASFRVAARSTRRVALTLRAGTYVLACGRCGRATLTVGTAPPAGPATPTPPPAPQDGKSLFRATCGGCHTLRDAGTTGTVGPDLDDEEPDYDDVVEQVNEGGGGMPSFRGSLTREQIDAIARYVSGATGGDGDDD